MDDIEHVAFVYGDDLDAVSGDDTSWFASTLSASLAIFSIPPDATAATKLDMAK